MSAPFRVSILDQSPIAEGSSGSEALHNTVRLAQLADRLGYHRYWVSEHHATPMLAGPSPEALIGPIAQATHTIRVGSGGVMLPHYSPLKVAETFSMLAGLFPGRIDLALGRAPGTDQRTSFALQRDRAQLSPDDFRDQLAELLGYLDDTLDSQHPFARLASTLPGLPESPTPWLLGSSMQSAVWAGELGLPYAFADFINPAGANIARLYRERFAERERPVHAKSGSASHSELPELAVGAWVICADTEQEAQRLASSSRMALALLMRGQLIRVPAPERALAFLEAERAAGRRPPRERREIIGTPQQVRGALEQLAQEYGAEEVFAVSITYDDEARRRSYELLAEALELRAREPQAVGL